MRRIAAIVLLLAGITVLLWPCIHRKQVQQQVTQTADTFLSEEKERPYPELYAAMVEYNQALFNGGQISIAPDTRPLALRFRSVWPHKGLHIRCL